MPLISVIMPVFDTEQYVQAAIDSILRQTLSDFEFVIVDDGSTDGTPAILERAANSDTRIKLSRRANTGITPALNEAIGMSSGKYLARMDGDDIALPSRFERQVAFLESQPEIVVVGTQIERMDPEGAPLCRSNFPTASREIDAALLGRRAGRWPIAHPTVMMRRDAVEAAGCYDESFLAGEDRDLFLRLAERGPLANIDEVLLRYRCRPESISYATATLQRSMSVRAIEFACNRRGIDMPRDLTPADGADGNDDPHLRWAKWALHSGYCATARKHSLAALRRNPFSWRAIKTALRASRILSRRQQQMASE